MKTRRPKRSCTTSPRTLQTNPILTRSIMDDIAASERRKEKAKLQRLKRKRKSEKIFNANGQIENFSSKSVDSFSGSDMIASDIESMNSEIEGQSSIGVENYQKNNVIKHLPENETPSEIREIKKSRLEYSAEIVTDLSHANKSISESKESFPIIEFIEKNGIESTAKNEIVCVDALEKNESEESSRNLESSTSSKTVTGQPIPNEESIKPTIPMDIGCSRILEISKVKAFDSKQKNLHRSDEVERENQHKSQETIEPNLDNLHQNKFPPLSEEAGSGKRIEPKQYSTGNPQIHVNESLGQSNRNYSSKSAKNKSIDNYSKDPSLKTKVSPNNTLNVNIQEKDKNSLSKERNQPRKKEVSSGRIKRVTNIQKKDKRPLPVVHRVKCPICSLMFDPFDIEYHASRCGNHYFPSNKSVDEQNRSKKRENSTNKKDVMTKEVKTKSPSSWLTDTCKNNDALFSSKNVRTSERNGNKIIQSPLSTTKEGYDSLSLSNIESDSSTVSVNKVGNFSATSMSANISVKNGILSRTSKTEPNVGKIQGNSSNNAIAQNCEDMLQPESSCFNMFSTALPKCDQMPQHTKMALKEEQTNFLLSERNKSAKRSKSSVNSSFSTTKYNGQSFLEAVGIVMKKDMLIQNAFPSYIDMNRSPKKRNNLVHQYHNSDDHIVPLSIKTHASVNDAGLFLNKLKMLATDAKKHHQSSSKPKDEKVNKILEPNIVIIKALAYIRKARDGESSVLYLMKKIKVLIRRLVDQFLKPHPPRILRIEQELITLFESFLPSYYTLENIVAKKYLEEYTPSLCVRTHTSILWDRKPALQQSIGTSFTEIQRKCLSSESNSSFENQDIKGISRIAKSIGFDALNDMNPSQAMPQIPTAFPNISSQSIPSKPTESMSNNLEKPTNSSQRHSSLKLNENLTSVKNLNTVDIATSVAPTSASMNTDTHVDSQISVKGYTTTTPSLGNHSSHTTNGTIPSQRNAALFNEMKHQMEFGSIVNERKKEPSQNSHVLIDVRHNTLANEMNLTHKVSPILEIAQNFDDSTMSQHNMPKGPNKSQVSVRKSLVSQNQHPKIAKPTNAFTHFCRKVKPEIEKQVQKDHNIPLDQIKKVVGEQAKLQWKALPDAKREIFRKKSKADFERYESEIEKRKLSIQQLNDSLI